MTGLYAVITGDGKLVGLFSTNERAEDFIKYYQKNFTSELRWYEIHTDIIINGED